MLVVVVVDFFSVNFLIVIVCVFYVCFMIDKMIIIFDRYCSLFLKIWFVWLIINRIDVGLELVCYEAIILDLRCRYYFVVRCFWYYNDGMRFELF